MKNIIRGNVNLSSLLLTELLDLSDVDVQLDFYCGFNNLTNLIGSPKSVGGSFSCIKSNLTSLIGATQDVADRFDCGSNNLISLEGAPKIIFGGFNCTFNNLTNLIGAPKTVGGNFSCNGNNLTSLKGIPKRIGYGEDFFKEFNISKELKGRFPEEYIRSLSDIRGSIVYW